MKIVRQDSVSSLITRVYNMGTTMNRESFEKLISENLDWLLQQERTFERDHIEAILRDAADKQYPVKWPVPRILQTQKISFTPTLDYLYINCYGDLNAVQQLRHFLGKFRDHNFIQLISEKGDGV